MPHPSILCLLLLSLVWASACSPNGRTPVSRLRWDAASVDDETKNTHLWIVSRSLDILRRDPNADVESALVRAMDGPHCSAAWRRGLIDADFLAAHNGGAMDLAIGASPLDIVVAGATWKGHFYDPDTGLNYKGESETTAYSQALANAVAAKAAWSTQDDSDSMRSACYALGLSLHFVTDLTQPMHAVNFTSISRPRGLHSNLESYATSIQEEHRLEDWSGRPTGSSADFIVTVARRAKALWPETHAAVAAAYLKQQPQHPLWCGDITASSFAFASAQQIDRVLCWAGDAAVKEKIGAALRLAQEATAQFLFLIGTEL